MCSGQSSAAGMPRATAVIPPLKEEWGVIALFSIRYVPGLAALGTTAVQTDGACL